MIRGFSLLLGLVLGLALAGLWGGTLGHLRQVAGDRLPGWTAGLRADSRLVEGGGLLNGALLHWRRDGAGLALSLDGADWQATGRARLDGAALRIGDLAGIVPLAWLGAGEGMLALDGGEVRLRLDGTPLGARIEGQVRGAGPAGPVTLVWDGTWSLTAR